MGHKQVETLIATLVTASIALLVVLASPAAAQGETEVNGTLQYRNESGERIPVEGVDITVEDDSGTEISRATSGTDGRFTLSVPDSGEYVATIVVETLPEGVSLRNPDETTKPVTGASITFPLVEGDGGAVSNGQSALDSIARLFVLGVLFGLIIAMCAIGLSLIFGTTGLVNFAHGELVSAGAIICYGLNVGLSVPFLLAAPVAIILTAALGGLNDRGLWQPLRARGTGLIAQLVISIGLSILVRYFLLWQLGGRRSPYREFSLQTDPLIDIGPISLVPRQVVTIVISVAVLYGVALVLQRTRFGKAMRAVADNRPLASSSGINVERIILYVWVLGAGLAGLGGILYGLDRGVNWDMGFDLLLLIFAAVTLGGLGTAYGALVGSLIIGILVQVSTYWIPAELKSVGALLVLALILLVRPQGILGQKERIG